MRRARKLDYITLFFLSAAIVFTLASIVKYGSMTTFADGEESETFVTTGPKYVTFYDNGKKTTVRTEATTVRQVIAETGLTLAAGDKVEPGLDTEINADNFFINIYRARPIIVRDGMNEKYLMSASYDARSIAAEAGLTLYDGDEITTKRNEGFLENGMATVYNVTRNGGRTLTVEEEIPFAEEKIKDYNMAPGTSEVRQLGQVGTKKIYYNILYIDGVEASRELIREEVVREPVTRIVAEGASAIERKPLTARMGVNNYTVTVNGVTVLRKETYYDLPMSGVMKYCGGGTYHIREDGAKVDEDGYVLVAAHLGRYPRCSVVETSLGLGKVYDTGAFAETNPEQFDLATDWTNRDGK